MTHAHQTAAASLERALFEVKKVIVGQDHMVERLFVALLARGHILLEGLPGVAKTLAISTLAEVSGGTFSRLQFTPDLLPSDLTGTRIFRASDDKFDIEWGPVFANLVLTDEINRAPAKVQSALLEVMAERQVSIAGQTRPLPRPFLVLATQNPVESEGVYTLPEAQRDRFLMKVNVPYPSPAEEMEIVRRVGTHTPHAKQVLTTDDLEAFQVLADDVYVDTAVVQYAVDLVMATREPAMRNLPELEPYLEFGVSPRATLGLVAAARALALLRGNDYVLPQDVFDVARDVLRHRLMVSYEALAKGLTADDLLNRLLAVVPAAELSPKLARPTSTTGNGNGYSAAPPPPAEPSAISSVPLAGGAAPGAAPTIGAPIGTVTDPTREIAPPPPPSRPGESRFGEPTAPVPPVTISSRVSDTEPTIIDPDEPDTAPGSSTS